MYDCPSTSSGWAEIDGDKLGMSVYEVEREMEGMEVNEGGFLRGTGKTEFFTLALNKSLFMPKTKEPTCLVTDI